VVTFVAAAPVVALAWAALFFTGLPIGTALPMMDWPIFAAGVALALGGLCVLAFGYRRVSERVLRAGPNPAGPDAREEEEFRIRPV
jgi:hypothetical protein